MVAQIENNKNRKKVLKALSFLNDYISLLIIQFTLCICIGYSEIA